MSVFPKPGGAVLLGRRLLARSGPPSSDIRQASTAGQSSALRTSFQTAAP